MSRSPLPLGHRGRVNRRRLPNGTWKASCRYRDHDGVTRPVSATGPTGAAAERNLLVKLDDRTGTAAGELGPMTRLAAFAERWATDLAESDRSDGTKEAYTDTLRRHILPALGELRVKEISAGVVYRFLRTIGERSGPSQAKRSRVVLAAVLQVALHHDAVQRNVAKDAGTVAGSGRREVKALTAEQVRELRAALAAPPKDRPTVAPGVPNAPAAPELVRDLVDLMAATGCRIGEALAVQWHQIDLGEEPTLTVDGTLVTVGGRLYRQDHPKSRAGHRVVLLPSWVVPMLLRRQVEQAGDWVFPSRSGGPVSMHNWRRSFRDSLARTGLPWAADLTPHVFRKSVATAIDRGADVKTAAAQLGHSSTAITEKSYVAKAAVAPDSRSILEAFGA